MTTDPATLTARHEEPALRSPAVDARLPAVLRGRWQPIAAIVVFTVIAIIFSGGSPVSSTQMPLCACGDAAQGVWFLEWPAFAITHGYNPLFSYYAAYPGGFDLMSLTSMPLLGLLFTPLTIAAGPVVTFNLLVRLAFISSATSMMFVLRRYTSWWPAAFVGGLLYGFSPYMLNEGYSHLFLIFAPLPPIMLMLVEDIVYSQKWHPLKAGVVLGLLAALEFMISPETLTITALIALAGVVIVTLRHPVAARERILPVLKALGGAGITFVVLVAYPVWAYIDGPRHVSGQQHTTLTYVLFHDDLFGSIVPSTYQLLGLQSWKATGTNLLQGNGVDHVTYLGVPLVLALFYIAIRFRRIGLVTVTALLALASLVLTLGPKLYVDGTAYVPSLRLPYDVLLHFPFVDGLLAPRFIFTEFLAVAVVLAIGLDRIRSEGFIGRSARDLSASPAQSVPTPVQMADGESPPGDLVPPAPSGSLALSGGAAVVSDSNPASSFPAPSSPADPSLSSPSGAATRRRTFSPRGVALRTAGCVAIAVLVLAPLLPKRLYKSQRIPVQSFFRNASTLDRIPTGSVVLPYPNAQYPTIYAPAFPQVEAMLWQSDTQMHFRMIGAYAAQPYIGGHVGEGDELYDSPKVVQELFGYALYGAPAVAPVKITRSAIAGLRAFCARYDISTVLVDPTIGADPALVISYVSRGLGAPPDQVGGIDAWFDVPTLLAKIPHDRAVLRSVR